MPLNEEEIEENMDFCGCVAAASLPVPAPTCPTEEALSTGRSAPDDALERDMRRMACARGLGRLLPSRRVHHQLKPVPLRRKADGCHAESAVTAKPRNRGVPKRLTITAATFEQ
jgi:hypothetical protein